MKPVAAQQELQCMAGIAMAVMARACLDLVAAPLQPATVREALQVRASSRVRERPSPCALPRLAINQRRACLPACVRAVPFSAAIYIAT